MLNSESGPKDIFARFRFALGVRYDAHSNPYGTNWVAEGVLCFYCLSVWVAFGVIGLLALGVLIDHATLTMFMLLPFAVSGGAIFLKKWAG